MVRLRTSFAPGEGVGASVRAKFSAVGKPLVREAEVVCGACLIGLVGDGRGTVSGWAHRTSSSALYLSESNDGRASRRIPKAPAYRGITSRRLPAIACRSAGRTPGALRAVIPGGERYQVNFRKM